MNDGEWVFNAEYGREAEQHWGRQIFLYVVSRVEPAVLGTLRDEVHGVYLETSRDLDHPDTAGAMRAWAARWNLSEPWVLEYARQTLEAWGMTRWKPGEPHPPRRGMRIGNWPDRPAKELRWEFGHRVAFPRVEPPQPPPVRVIPWEPTLVRWTDYAAAQREQFDLWLTRYRAIVDRWAAENDMAPTTRKRSRRDDGPLAHYEWLARWQVQGWTQQAIGKHYGRREEKTVADAIRRTSELIGLARRSLTTPE